MVREPTLNLPLNPLGVEGGCDGQEKLVVAAFVQKRGCVQEARQVGSNLFSAASRPNRDPLFGADEGMLGGILLSRRGSPGEFGRWLSAEIRATRPVTVK